MLSYYFSFLSSFPLMGRMGVFSVPRENDPVLAGMIFQYTDKAKKELKQQEQMMQLVSTGHIWIKEEVEGTTNLQKEFNNYLDRFNSIISYAAQIYGFYHEIDRLVGQLGTYSHQLSHQTTNALAVALSANRNKLYRELVMSSVEIVNDVRQVCLSNNKMTEKQRLEIVFGIRPKLKLMNQKLKRLIRAVKYTRLSDVWAEIDYGARSEVDKPTIVQRCKNDGEGMQDNEVNVQYIRLTNNSTII